ncbi:chondroitin synthase [mine drainage metagenome]|uniref:Chondroitin synthase n=1 Tax=mine drainage metagenome TaxID=410659 RepID=A0A1J5RC71_9ZZZZ
MGRPFFSILTPVYEPPIDALEAAIASVRTQTYGDWELILVDDRSPSDTVRERLRTLAADSRITVIERDSNGGIVAASNDAIAAASGEFLVLLDNDDLLHPRALEKVAAAIAAEPDVDYVYTDEDKIDARGGHYDEFRKPAWSPERLRGQMYTSHLSVLRASLVREVGGFHSGFDGSQDHDLVLRVTERARRVTHVPEVLYHWRVVPGSTAGDAEAKPYAWDAGRRAVQAHLDRVGVRGEVQFGTVRGTLTINREASSDHLVSVIIPTRGGSGIVWGEERVFVVEAVRSILQNAGYPHLEIVVVYDLDTPVTVRDALVDLAGDQLRLVAFTETFNFSAKCNAGFLAATGDVIVLLNDDIQATQPGFLARLIAPLDEQGVGMTGARLLFADGRLQHGGHVYAGGELMHAFIGAGMDDPGPFAALHVSREISGLTAACVALSRETYEEVGGMCESLPVNFNDVDLSMKVRSLGLRLLWLENVTVYHFESQTREPVVHRWEYEFVTDRWFFPNEDLYLRM